MLQAPKGHPNAGLMRMMSAMGWFREAPAAVEAKAGARQPSATEGKGRTSLLFLVERVPLTPGIPGNVRLGPGKAGPVPPALSGGGTR